MPPRPAGGAPPPARPRARGAAPLAGLPPARAGQQARGRRDLDVKRNGGFDLIPLKGQELNAKESGWGPRCRCYAELCGPGVLPLVEEEVGVRKRGGNVRTWSGARPTE